MPNSKKHIIEHSFNFFTKSLIAVALLIFVNFTFAIQYVNLTNYGLTLTEIVEEEEEKEEHKHDLLELLVNNTNVIQRLPSKFKEPILEIIVAEVSTPPPDLS